MRETIYDYCGDHPDVEFVKKDIAIGAEIPIKWVTG